MEIEGITAVVTGGASGLGRATVERPVKNGAAKVVIADLPSTSGETVAKELGDAVQFMAADVRRPRGDLGRAGCSGRCGSAARSGALCRTWRSGTSGQQGRLAGFAVVLLRDRR